MFDYISGTLIEKTENYAVVDAGGIGYRIFSTKTSLDDMGEAGRNVKLYIFMNIKNASDMVSLYGFSTKEERNTFEMILGVSGVGAKTAYFPDFLTFNLQLHLVIVLILESIPK